MSKATVCVAFICGAAVGIGGTWQYFKKKYEAQAQEEIESVKESLAKRYEKKTMTITLDTKDDNAAKFSGSHSYEKGDGFIKLDGVQLNKK